MKKLVAVLEGILQAFVALGALPCGVLLMIDPSGAMLNMPLSMLKGSPFADFFWPGLVLFAVMGLGLMIWIFMQVSLIGGGHWLQYLYFALGTAEVSLSVLMLAKPGTDADHQGAIP